MAVRYIVPGKSLDKLTGSTADRREHRRESIRAALRDFTVSGVSNPVKNQIRAGLENELRMIDREDSLE